MRDIEPRPCNFGAEPATHECARCGRAYCDAHGGALCQACLAPAGGVPSAGLVRGSLVALAVGAAVGFVVLVWSPTLPGEHRVARSPAQNPGAVQPFRPAGRGVSSAVPTPRPQAAVSPTAPAVRSYTVIAGDTLSQIAENFGTTVAAIQAANPGVTPTSLRPGQELLIPPPGGIPTPTSAPAPSATPAPTATPVAAASATPVPTAVATPSAVPPTATPSPSPVPSPSPSPTPEGQ